jgi:Sulfotransferase domain
VSSEPRKCPEQMTGDFAAILDRMASFLGYELTGGEKQRIAEKCSFQYMKDNKQLFEMSPLHVLGTQRQFMASGKEYHYADVAPAIAAGAEGASQQAFHATIFVLSQSLVILDGSCV